MGNIALGQSLSKPLTVYNTGTGNMMISSMNNGEDRGKEEGKRRKEEEGERGRGKRKGREEREGKEKKKRKELSM